MDSIVPVRLITTVLFAILLPFTAQAAGLLEVLRDSGASKFAATIDSDPFLSNLYLSSGVQTVFAPSDDTPGAKVKRQETPAEEQGGSYQASNSIVNLNLLNTPPGTQIQTKNTNATLGGKPQSVVSGTGSTNSGPLRKRTSSVTELYDLSPRDSQNSTLHTNDTSPSLPRIFSGLGNNVSIIKGDIHYDGGLIQLVDGYFTLPQTLSSTTYATGHTTFTALTNSSNLTAELDSTAGLTALIPTNAAFASANVSSTNPTTPSLMDAHIIPNFVGYLPALTNGLKLLTQAGTIVTVTVKGNDFYLNNAKIIASNLILENGVAHVLDQVLSFGPSSTAPTPTTNAPNASVIPFTGGGSSIKRETIHVESVLISCNVVLFLVLFIL